MSNITTVLLSPGGWADDSRAVAELNARLGDLCRRGPGYWELKDSAESASAWGGSKAPPPLYAGVLNSLPFGEFARIVADLPWSNPEALQVMVMFDYDDRYRVLTLADLRSWPEG